MAAALRCYSDFRLEQGDGSRRTDRGDRVRAGMGSPVFLMLIAKMMIAKMMIAKMMIAKRNGYERRATPVWTGSRQVRIPR